MRNPDDGPDFIIIDLRDPIQDFSKMRHQYFLYQRFPLHEIIRAILVMNAYNDDTHEMLWYETEARFEDNWDILDLEHVDFFYALLQDAVDSHIRQKVPEHIDPCNYVFEKWIDQTSIIMRRDSGP